MPGWVFASPTLRSFDAAPFAAPSMLIRTVRMTFQAEAVEDFLRIFDASAPRIRAFPGCLFLELWQDLHHPHILTTHSHWADTAALEQYRQSPLFKSTWAETKPLFAAPPHAHSHEVVRSADQIAARI